MSNLLRQTLVRTAVLVLASLFWFLVFEYGARLWIQYAGDPLDRARLVMQPDPKLLWRMRPSFDGLFEKVSLKTDAFSHRISAKPQPTLGTLSPGDWVVLGPSSAFGWGVEFEDTYASVATKHQNVAVFNTAQIGYGIQQGLRQYDALRPELQKSKHTILVAFGVNDVDRFRFFGRSGISDHDFFADSAAIDALNTEYWIYRAAFPSMFFRILQEMTFKLGCPPAEVLAPRNSEQGFINDLDLLLSKISADGHKSVIIDSPMHYPFEPDEQLAQAAEENFKKSAAAAKSGNCTQARDFFSTARRDEPHRVSFAIRSLNIAIQKYVEQQTIQNRPILIQASRQLVSPLDFVDPIHFSQLGHKKIAGELINLVANSAP